MVYLTPILSLIAANTLTLQKTPASLSGVTCIASADSITWYQIVTTYVVAIFGMTGPLLALGVLIIIITQKVCKFELLYG